MQPGRWYTNEEMKALRSKGFSFDEGRYTADEDAKLRDLVATFMEEHNLTEAEIGAVCWPANRGTSDIDKEMATSFWSQMGNILETINISQFPFMMSNRSCTTSPPQTIIMASFENNVPPGQEDRWQNRLLVSRRRQPSH